MKLAHRRGVFYLSTLIFIVVGVYLTLIVQGFIFDFKTFQIIKTGSIFLDFQPTNNVTLFVNGDKRKIQTSFLNEGALIKNLIPGTYHILLSRSGFQNWEKVLKVTSGLATPRTSIRLFSKEPPYKKLAEHIFSFSQIGDGFVEQSASGTVVYGKNVFKNTYINLINGTLIIASSIKSWVSADLNNTSSTINISNIFNTLKKSFDPPVTAQISNVLFHPFSPGKFLISTKSAIYVLDPKRPSLDRLFVSSSTPITDFKTDNSEIIVNLKNKVAIINLILQTTNTYNISSESVNNLKSTSDGNKILFTNDNGYLFLYDKTTKLVRAFGSKPEEFYFSPEERRVVEIVGNKIVITYLEKWSGDIRKKPFEKTVVSLPENKNKYSSFTWLDGKYFLILQGNDLLVSEIDEETPINTSVLARDIQSFKVKDNNTIFTLTSQNELREIDLSVK